MLQIKKLTIGIQPADKAFRVQSLWGEVLDAITASRGKKPIDQINFDAISVSSTREQFALKGEERGVTFALSAESVYYQKSAYGRDGGVNLEKFIEEFIFLWGVAQKKLSISGVRRIGLVAEHRRFGIESPSDLLASRLVSYPVERDAEKFNLSFEKRIDVNGGAYQRGQPFINVIHNLYDAKLDAEVPESSAINFNLDVQRYYSPLLDRVEADTVNIVKRQFESQWRSYQAELTKLGLVE